MNKSAFWTPGKKEEKKEKELLHGQGNFFLFLLFCWFSFRSLFLSLSLLIDSSLPGFFFSFLYAPKGNRSPIEYMHGFL